MERFGKSDPLVSNPLRRFEQLQGAFIEAFFSPEPSVRSDSVLIEVLSVNLASYQQKLSEIAQLGHKELILVALKSEELDKFAIAGIHEYLRAMGRQDLALDIVIGGLERGKALWQSILEKPGLSPFFVDFGQARIDSLERRGQRYMGELSMDRVVSRPFTLGNFPFTIYPCTSV